LLFLDSLIYHIKTTDFYEDFAANHSLLDRINTANLPRNHVADRNKVPGYFSDEVDANIITEFYALRVKSSACHVYSGYDDRVGGEKIKTKGIRQHVVKSHIST